MIFFINFSVNAHDIDYYEDLKEIPLANYLFSGIEDDKLKNEASLNSKKIKYILSKKQKYNYYGNIIDPNFYYLKHDDVKKVLSNYIVNKYKNISTKNANNIVDMVFIEGDKKNIDPILILSIIEHESSFNRNAKNKSTASGLMQVVPKYHKKTINKVVVKKGGNIYTIENNIEIGTEIFFNMLKKYKFNVRRTLQAYNGNHRGTSYSSGVINKQNELIKIINNIYIQ